MSPALRPFLLVLTIALASGAAIADDRHAEFSEANQLLFLTPHMTALDREGMLLRYRYERSGELQQEEDIFSDHISMEITKVHEDDFRGADIQFLSGPRERPFPPVRQARGNPVLAGFLQHDVNRMGQAANQPMRYFQNRIKMALEEDPDIVPVTFDYGGEELEGTRIRITPYANDPDRRRYDREYWDKYYVFIVSEDVPGHIYRIEAVAPNADGEPYYSDILTLESVESPGP